MRFLIAYVAVATGPPVLREIDADLLGGVVVEFDDLRLQFDARERHVDEIDFRLVAGDDVGRPG